jgi:hypothetical protein
MKEKPYRNAFYSQTFCDVNAVVYVFVSYVFSIITDKYIDINVLYECNSMWSEINYNPRIFVGLDS